MTKSQRWLPIFLLAIGLGFAPERAASQEPEEPGVTEEMLNKSHEPIPFPPELDPKDLMDKRLASKQLGRLIEEFNKKNGHIDPNKATELLKDLQVDSAKNPELKPLAEILERIKQPGGFAELSKDPADLLGKLKELQKTLLGSTNLPNLARDKESPDKASNEKNPAEEASAGSGGGAAPEPGSSDAAGSGLTEKLINLTQKLAPALRKSPALQRVMRDLSRYTGTEDPRWQKMSAAFQDMGTKLESVSQTLHLDRLPLDKLGLPGGLAPSKLPTLRLPGGGSLGKAAELGGPGQPSESRGWEAILAIGGLFGIAALVAKLLAGSEARRVAQRNAGWELGPWPVDPAAVATREDLIRAFEYLSLRNLGPAARNWNHLAIADRLGVSPTATTGASAEPTPVDQGAAAELASLYEQARYAPPADTLSDAALAAARRDLCLLAGVAQV